jgi:prepilin-type N-terminal cleavage/methylation domain-containing protein
MSMLPTPASRGAEEHGYTLIEMLIAMVVGSVVVLAAFALLRFTTSDVSRITARVHVDQRGRLALEKIMLELHSDCVAPTVIPIQSGSTSEVLEFISANSPVNEKYSEPVSSLPTVYLHKITYTPEKGNVQGTLVEESRPSTGQAPKYKFNKAETATKVLLLRGVKQSLTTEKTAIPIFQYYRYYHEGDHEPVYGKLDPSPVTPSTEAEKITKVTMSFTLAPESSEGTSLSTDRPVALEDSAVFRLAPASETPSKANLPCT